MDTYYLRCADCGHEMEEDDFYIGCPECNGFLEVVIPDRIDRSIDQKYDSIFKYHRLMPFDPSNGDMTSRESITEMPLFKAHQISEYLDVELFCKDETLFPTGTWKDREGFVSLHRLIKNDVQNLTLFSSGNTGTSLSRSAGLFKGPTIHLVVPEASRNRVTNEKVRRFFDHDYVHLQFYDGSNDECSEYAERFARDNNYQVEGGFRNYARREGLKLLGLEYIYQSKEEIDWYVQAVAGGIGIYSFFKAHNDSNLQCPRMLGVQPSICNPMVRAWNDDSPVLRDRHIPDEVVPSPFVRVLRTRKPGASYPILKPIMDRVGGRFTGVQDEAILEALRLFYKEDYFVEQYHSGTKVGLEPATALAGIMKGVQKGFIEPGQKVLLNVSGAAKEGDVKEEWISDLV